MERGKRRLIISCQLVQRNIVLRSSLTRKEGLRAKMGRFRFVRSLLVSKANWCKDFCRWGAFIFRILCASFLYLKVFRHLNKLTVFLFAFSTLIWKSLVGLMDCFWNGIPSILVRFIVVLVDCPSNSLYIALKASKELRKNCSELLSSSKGLSYIIFMFSGL